MIKLRTYELQLRLNKSQAALIDRWFYEAKCFYNWCLTQEDVFAVNACMTKVVKKLDKDGNEVEVELSSIPAKLKQNVHRKLCDSIKGLSVSKKKGKVVGRLKFKSEIPSLHFDVQSLNIQGESIWLVGFGRTHLRAHGLHQLGDTFEVRSGNLIRRSGKYLLKVTVKKEFRDRVPTGKVVGLDFGISDNVVTSEGDKFNCKLPESSKLKHLQRKEARQRRLNSNKRTKNSQKTRNEINREYQKLSNQKQDFANKLVSYLDTNYDIIAFQDEMIASWHKGLFGKQVQHSCLGAVKSKLIARMVEEPERYILVSRSMPSTQLCPICGTLTKHPLDKRAFTCSGCGHTEDRDIHAAKNMLLLAHIAQ